MMDSTGVSVVIADNNDFYRQVLGDFYRELGFTVDVATDGIEALELIEGRVPDLVVLDLIMPRIDGAQLCSLLKDRQAYRNIPVIILSGILADEIENLETIQADAYIAKMPLAQIQAALKEVSKALLCGQPSSEPLIFGFDKMFRREVVLELLEERRARHDILDSLSEGIVELSAQRRVLSTNRAVQEITGQQGSELLSRKLQDIFPESERELDDLFVQVLGGARVASAIVARGERKIQLKLHRLNQIEENPEGGRGRLQRAISAASKSNTKVRLESMYDAVTFTIMVEDVTSRERALEEREELRRRLALSEKMSAVGLLASGAAHELNNPLTSVLGYAQLIQKKEKDPVLRDSLAKIVSGATRCRDIVENLKSFSRHVRPQKSREDLHEVIRSALGSMEDAFRRAGVRIETSLMDGNADVDIDREQITQAIRHVLDNAVKALEQTTGARILRVATSRPKGLVRLQISDTGPGMSEADLPRVFEPFFTTRTVGQGVGLGLSVVYGIMRAHAGSVSLGSAAEGGVILELDLPARQGAAVGQSRATEAEAPGTGRGRILIIDDETVVQDLLCDILEGLDLQIETASNGFEGLEKINQSEFDLIILDFRMPDMTGEQVYEELARRDPALLRKLMFITADTLTPETQIFLERIDSPWLAKPFSVESVVSQARSILAAG